MSLRRGVFQQPASPAARASTDIDVQDAVAEVANAINAAAVEVEATKMRIEEIELEFQTYAQEAAGGVFSLKVIGLGLEVGTDFSRERTNAVCVTLAPAPPTRDIAVGDVAAELKLALETIIQATTDLPDHLRAKGATVEITFVLNKEGHFEIIVKGGVKRSETHIARLKLVA